MNVSLPARTPVDLYAATGITPGVKLKVTNLTTGDARLSITEPGLLDNHVPVAPYGQATNDLGDAEAWALSTGGGGINVEAI